MICYRNMKNDEQGGMLMVMMMHVCFQQKCQNDLWADDRLKRK